MFRFLFARRMFGGFRNAVSPDIYPENDAVLEAGGGQFIWAVPCCVLCRKSHRHGGGVIGKHDPRKALGHRAAHCMAVGFRSGSGYILTDRDPEHTARIIQTALARLTRRVQ
jgi:hypothetical protein